MKKKNKAINLGKTWYKINHGKKSNQETASVVIIIANTIKQYKCQETIE